MPMIKQSTALTLKYLFVIFSGSLITTLLNLFSEKLDIFTIMAIFPLLWGVSLIRHNNFEKLFSFGTLGLLLLGALLTYILHMPKSYYTQAVLFKGSAIITVVELIAFALLLISRILLPDNKKINIFKISPLSAGILLFSIFVTYTTLSGVLGAYLTIKPSILKLLAEQATGSVVLRGVTLIFIPIASFIGTLAAERTVFNKKEG